MVEGARTRGQFALWQERHMTNSRLIGLLLAAAACAGAGTAWAQNAYDDPDPIPAYPDDPSDDNDAGMPSSDDSDAAIDDRVRFSLAQALGADRASDISVRTVDGIVYLGGDVPTEDERRIAQDAVYQADGVRGLRIENLYARTYYDDADESNPYRY
jgi:hypothetical protein